MLFIPGPSLSTATARLMLVMLCFGWGTAWVSMRIALEEVPPFAMRVWSLAMGAALLIAFARLQGRPLAIAHRRTWLHIAVASLFNIVAFSVLTPYAQLAAETSRVVILVYTMPIWAALIARAVLGERLTVSRLTGLALCVAGMTVLIVPLFGHVIPIGILLALGVALGWAAGTVYLKWARLEGDPTAITIWQIVFGMAVMALLMLIFEDPSPSSLSTRGIIALIYSGLIGSGLSYFLWFETLRRVSTSTASLGVLASPVVGIVAAVIVLGERPTWPDVIGFALMLSASAIVLLRPDGAIR